jgi:hypothetical protein
VEAGNDGCPSPDGAEQPVTRAALGSGVQLAPILLVGKDECDVEGPSGRRYDAATTVSEDDVLDAELFRSAWRGGVAVFASATREEERRSQEVGCVSLW